MRSYWVYILTNEHNGVLYIGVTNNLAWRVYEHKQGAIPGFTSQYNVKKLVYFEEWPDIRGAIEREKQLKKGPRRRKVELVNRLNPGWKDLAEEMM